MDEVERIVKKYGASTIYNKSIQELMEIVELECPRLSWDTVNEIVGKLMFIKPMKEEYYDTRIL